jgi:hypothetical protein
MTTADEQFALRSNKSETRRAPRRRHPQAAGVRITKNKHLLLSGQIPTHGFTVALSVFGGTPPGKALKL